MKNIIFIVEGGIGKNICATAVVRALKKKNPDSKIIVVAGFTEVFANNPNVFRTYHMGNAQFLMDDYIKDNEAEVIKYEPYLHKDYLGKTKHVSECWLDGLGLEGNHLPEIFLSSSEKKEAAAFIKTLKKPIFALQTHGGVPKQKMYYRNLPVEIAEKVVDKIKEKYSVMHFRYKDQPEVAAAVGTMFGLREVFALLPHVKNSLVIDSFLQHAAVAVGSSMNVVWAGTSPVCLGYDVNNNIEPQNKCGQPYCHRPNSYLFDSNNGKPWVCPYDEVCFQYEPEFLLGKIGETKPTAEHQEDDCCKK